MAEKTGYEIRADLLHLAYSIVERNADMAYNASETLIQQESVSFSTRTWTPFTVDDIVRTAEKLNEFVTRK